MNRRKSLIVVLAAFAKLTASECVLQGNSAFNWVFFRSD